MIRVLLKYLFLALVLTCFQCQVFAHRININNPMVNIPSLGSVRGSVNESSFSHQKFYQFQGISYGETTSGQNRFKLPQAKRGWNNILDGTLERWGCPVGRFSRLEVVFDMEDCLHLSVYTKNLNGHAPVMVVLNGEMYFESVKARQPANYFMEKDIVLVVPQFRTGILGFLSTETEDIPGNVGVFDAALALEWVQTNIRYFGGDPTKVTLVGQSGGAVIAHALSLSPKISKNLFHQLILQSGSALAPNTVRGSPVEYAKYMADFFECPRQASIQDINQCFIDLPIKELIEKYVMMGLSYNKEIPDNMGVKLTLNDVNGLFPDSPQNLVNSRSNKKYPLIAGVTKHDGMFAFDDFYITMFFDDSNYNKSYISYHIIDDFLEKCGVEDKSGSLKAMMRTKLFSQSDLILGDLFYLIPGFVDMASFITMKSPIYETVQRNYRQEPNTYLYSFDYKGEHTRFGYGDDKSESPYSGGVCHNDENIYLFPFPDYASNLNVVDRIMSQTMVELWTSFAENGKPFSNEVTEWPPVNTMSGPYLKINEISEIGDDFFDEFIITTLEQILGKTLLRPEKKSSMLFI